MERKEAFEHLRQASQNGNLIPVIGAGYSIASAGLPSWAGLLERGIRFCEDHRDRLTIPANVIDEIKTASANKDLLRGFDVLCDFLESPKGSLPLREWLDEVFKYQSVSKHEISNALRQLRPRTLLTTNIDTLLERERVVRQDNVATWSEWPKMIEILRGKGGILHLHGRFDIPESVVLSQKHYDRIVSADNKGENLAQSIFYCGVLLFIGTSPAGASDPHLSRLLEPFSELYGPVLDHGGSPPHFLLGMKDMPAHEQTKLRSLGIEPILYESHSELPGLIAGIDQRPAMVPVSSIPEFTRSLVSSSSTENLLDAVLEYLRKHPFQGESMSTVSLFRATSDWLGNKRLDLVWHGNQAPRNEKLPYPLSIAAWSMITGRIIASSRFGERGLTGRDDNTRDVRDLKRRGKWDDVRREILSAIDTRTSTSKRNKKADLGKSATVISLEQLKEGGKSSSEFVRRQSLRLALSLDTCSLMDLYHPFNSREDELQRNFDRTIVCVPIPLIGKGETAGQADGTPPNHVLCIDIPKGLKQPLLQSQVDHLTFVSDCLYLGKANWRLSRNR